MTVLRDVEIAKNDRKRLYDGGVQATQQKENIEKETTCRLEICTTSEVEKMRIQANLEVELKRLMLEERRLAIQERNCAYFTPPVYGSIQFVRIVPIISHYSSVPAKYGTSYISRMEPRG